MLQSTIDTVGNVTLTPINNAYGTRVNKPEAVKKPEVATQDNQADQKKLEGAVQKLNDYVAPALQTVEFSIDQESERIIVKVVDTETQEVLRQIPNDEVLAITKTLDQLQGLVVSETA